MTLTDEILIKLEFSDIKDHYTFDMLDRLQALIEVELRERIIRNEKT